MWVILLTFALWSIIFPPSTAKIIVPWALAAICFIGWKFASRKKHRAEKEYETPRRRVRRFK